MRAMSACNRPKVSNHGLAIALCGWVVRAVNGGFNLINPMKHIANSLNTQHLLYGITSCFTGAVLVGQGRQ